MAKKTEKLNFCRLRYFNTKSLWDSENSSNFAADLRNKLKFEIMTHQITLAQAACLYVKGQVFKYGRKTYEYLTTVSDVTPIQHNIIIVAYCGNTQSYECINVTGKENAPCYSVMADSKNK